VLPALWLHPCIRTLALKRKCCDWPEVLAQQGCPQSGVPGLVSGSRDFSVAANSALPTGGVWLPLEPGAQPRAGHTGGAQ
jgi:hypothetical protein